MNTQQVTEGYQEDASFGNTSRPQKKRKAELAEANADANSSTIYTVSLASLDIDVPVSACWLFSWNCQFWLGVV